MKIKEKYFFTAGLSLLLFIPLLFLFSCGSEEKNKQAPTFGNLRFGSDLSLSATVDYEKKVFEHFYPEAKLSPLYTEENELFASFINDSTRLIFGLRDFTLKEKQWLKDRKIIPYSTVIGIEGIALITNLEQSDTCIDARTFLNLLTGEGDSVKTLREKYKDIVFEGKGSSSLRYLDSIIQGKKLSEYVFSGGSADSVIAFVASHKNSIGVISYGHISNEDDPEVKGKRNKIKILSVSNDGKDYYRPCQRHFVNYKYPFTRRIYMHSRDYDGSLAMGFISFVCSEEGQMIIKQTSLLPARLYWRDMVVKYEPMNVK